MAQKYSMHQRFLLICKGVSRNDSRVMPTAHPYRPWRERKRFTQRNHYKNHQLILVTYYFDVLTALNINTTKYHSFIKWFSVDLMCHYIQTIKSCREEERRPFSGQGGARWPAQCKVKMQELTARKECLDNHSNRTLH
jgi:hypothetical protein